MSLNPHPTLPDFEYIRPATLTEACEFLSHHPDTARLFLGGTDVFVRMRDGFMKPEFLVDVKNLDGTNDIRFDPQGGLTIGAAVNMNRVAAFPDVQAPSSSGGGLSFSGELPTAYTRDHRWGNICNASPAGDALPVLAAAEAVVVLASADGERRVPFTAFYTGYRESVRRSDELTHGARGAPRGRSPVVPQGGHPGRAGDLQGSGGCVDGH